MTTPIDEPMFTVTIPPRPSTGPAGLYIPTEQRRPDDTASRIKLPAGVHTLQLLWRGEYSSIDLRFVDGTANGLTLVRMPGGENSTPVIYTLTIPPGGGQIHFVQNSAVTSEEINAKVDALGVTVFLNEARAPLT